MIAFLALRKRKRSAAAPPTGGTASFSKVLPTLNVGDTYVPHFYPNGLLPSPVFSGEGFNSGTAMVDWLTANWNAYGSWSLENGTLNLSNSPIEAAQFSVVSKAQKVQFTDTFQRTGIGASYEATTADNGTPVLTMNGSVLSLAANAEGKGSKAELRRKDILTGAEQWTQEITFTASSAGQGVGIGTSMSRTAGIYQRGLQFDFSTRKLVIYEGGNGASSTATLSAFVTGRRYKFKAELNLKAFIGTVTDLVTNEQITHTFAPFVGGRGYPMLSVFQTGAVNVESWTFADTVPDGKKTGFYGDSLTFGLGGSQTSLDTRYGTRVYEGNAAYFNVFGGPGEDSSHVLGAIKDITANGFYQATICIGTNEDNTVTYKARMIAIRDELVSRGIRPVFITLPPRNHYNTANMNAVLAEVATGFDLVDIYTPLGGGTNVLLAEYDSGDHLHGNAAWHQLVADLLKPVLL